MINSMQRIRKNRLRELFKNISLVIFAILVLLIIIEISVRIFFPQQIVVFDESLFSPDEVLGHRHNSNVLSHINTGERTVVVKTDEFGHRVGNQTNEQSAFDILAVGDSFLAAIQVEYDDIMTSRLEKTLSEKLGFPVSITNAGVGAYDLNQYNLVIEREFKRKEYDYVILFFYMEDDFEETRVDSFPPVERMYPRLGFPSAFSKEEFKKKIVIPMNEFFERNSHFYKFLKNRSKLLLGRIGLTGYWFPPNFYKQRADSEIWDINADFLMDIKDKCDSKGIGFLVVLIPTSYQVDQKQFYDYVRMFKIDEDKVDLDQPNKELKKRLDERGIQYVELLYKFREINQHEPLYGKIDTHFNPDGHKAAANIIEPVLLHDIQQLKSDPD